MKISWTPPRTPFNILQEQYYPDRWKIAIVCMFLNCTRRSVAEPIVSQFFEKFPTPEDYISAYENSREDILLLISRLGFKNRRSERIYKFSLDYSRGFRDISECHGIGDYASTCDKMFFEFEFGETPPEDGVLKNVWNWIVKNEK